MHTTTSALEAAEAFAAELRFPRPMDEVERLEKSIKDLWRDRLDGSAMDRKTAQAFARFFLTVGFTYKYKPYGVKIASPFGYSLFDLHAGQGFSFQIHSRPKREIFHILEAKPGAFAFLCTLDEWEAEGSSWVRGWAEGRRYHTDCPYLFRPQPGDCIAVPDSDVVHTVVGCVLEEYANCSTDAVERLFDQNVRNGLDLPASHRRLGEVLPEAASGPVRQIARQAGRWTTRPLAGNAPLIDRQVGIEAQRLLLGGQRRYEVAADPEWIHTFVPVAGRAECRFAGETLNLRQGDVMTVPPAWSARLQSDRGAVVAHHAVATSQALQDWD